MNLNKAKYQLDATQENLKTLISSSKTIICIFVSDEAIRI